MARLIYLNGPRMGEAVEVKENMVLGRQEGCSLVLDDPKVSRHHARIVREGARFVVVDLNSSNGTFLNGVRIEKSALNMGDRLRLGDTEFAFVPEPDDELLGRTISGFQFLKRMWHGAAGVYYLGRQVALDRDVTIYLLDKTLARDAASVAHFKDQVRAASMLRHPAVLRVFDVHEVGEMVFSTSETFNGKPLAEEIDRPPSPRRILQVGRQVAEALAEAHPKGIIHGAISPDVILVDKDGNVKLSGFAGLTQEIPVFSRSVKTLLYVSPEEVMGKPLMPASDIYSLALVLWHGLMGRPPFEEDSAPAMARVRCEREVPPVKASSPVITHLLANMCSRDPAKRPDARTVADALAEALKHIPQQRKKTAPRPVMRPSPRPTHKARSLPPVPARGDSPLLLLLVPPLFGVGFLVGWFLSKLFL